MTNQIQFQCLGLALRTVVEQAAFFALWCALTQVSYELSVLVTGNVKV